MESISFSIAGCEIRLLMPFRPEVTRGFQPFLCAPGEAPLTVSLLPVQALPEVRGRELLRNYAFAVFRTEDGFFRVFHDRREGDRPYAVGHLEPGGRETIEYLEADRGFFSETANCFSHIALEALLLQRDAMILHASFVSTRYGGLLFSGVSGIGKSTQADLWQRYEGAELLNGDRTVLRRMDGVWTAFGSPYAGSSNCFVNESRPVRAIVLLSQGSACSLRRLSPAAAFRGLYAGMTVNLWDDRYVARVCDLLAALDVPVYALTCTPDRAAVDCLKAELEHETA